MRVLGVDPERPSEAIVEEAVRALRRGGVIAFPTETFYGLGASILSESARKKVYRIKGREASKSLPWIGADLDQLEAHVIVSPAARFLAERFWPGPLTLVVPSRRGEEGDSVAVRVSGLPLARALASGLGHPITATSANASGAPPAETAEDLAPLAGLDLILDGGRTPGGAPSTIVDLTSGRARLVRSGKIPFESVAQVLAESSLIG